jgi:hypothetical protein
LHSEGGIELHGAIHAGYKHRCDITPPHAEAKQNLAAMVSGVSVGINSMVFAISQRLTVGVSALSFTTGPYVSLISGFSSMKGSTIMAPWNICAQGTFNMSLGAGIGYSMPRVVANVINTILGWFHAKPIPATGSIVALPTRLNLIDHKDEEPAGCSGP